MVTLDDMTSIINSNYDRESEREKEREGGRRREGEKGRERKTNE